MGRDGDSILPYDGLISTGRHRSRASDLRDGLPTPRLRMDDALVMSWQEHRDLPAISRLARETLVLVPLGLPFFVPLAFAQRFGLDFRPAFVIGLAFLAWLATLPEAKLETAEIMPEVLDPVECW